MKLQSYLRNKSISVTQAHILAKFRTRMANYANNYGGTNQDLPCRLCSNHSDKQEEIYTCEFNKQNVDLQGRYQDLFRSDVEVTVIKSLEALYKLRENKLS